MQTSVDVFLPAITGKIPSQSTKKITKNLTFNYTKRNSGVCETNAEYLIPRCVLLSFYFVLPRRNPGLRGLKIASTIYFIFQSLLRPFITSVVQRMVECLKEYTRQKHMDPKCHNCSPQCTIFPILCAAPPNYLQCSDRY